jgi:hypothetical protein
VRALFPLLVAVTGLAVAAAQAPAQCCYIAPPQAPDMRNPGVYYSNPYGVVYGPNYYVQPCFPPFQGMLLGPPNGANGSLMTLMGAFPRHLYARSPRDFFMYDTDPRVSPYNYGYVSSGVPTLPYAYGGNGGNGQLGGDKGIGAYAGD